MPGKGLGRGLDSLIPDFYDEDFDSNSTQSLEDMLNEQEEKVEEVETSAEEEKSSEKQKNIFEEIEEEHDKEDPSNTGGVSDVQDGEQEEVQEEEADEDNSPSEKTGSDISSQESIQTSQEIQVEQSHIDEVTQIVDKNPRITLWSSRSAAVLRYLRKTEPEFSISKEASTLIDEAVSKKYPEIWELFNQY